VPGVRRPERSEEDLGRIVAADRQPELARGAPVEVLQRLSCRLLPERFAAEGAYMAVDLEVFGSVVARQRREHAPRGECGIAGEERGMAPTANRSLGAGGEIGASARKGEACASVQAARIFDSISRSASSLARATAFSVLVIQRHPFPSRSLAGSLALWGELSRQEVDRPCEEPALAGRRVSTVECTPCASLDRIASGGEPRRVCRRLFWLSPMLPGRVPQAG
jgi:hypothetical protein